MTKYLLVVLTLLTTLAFGQVDSKRIKEQAEITARALLQEDFESLIKHTYPEIVKMLGGEEKMISLIRKGKIEMGQQGISFEKVTIGNPSRTVNAGDEIHCLIPQTILMKVPKGKVKSETYLLAVSKDNGNHWYFIDTANLTMDNIKNVLPNYNTQLQLPIKRQPKFTAD